MTVAPVGLLVIRAWLEEGAERPLRVQVRMTADTGRGFQRELAFSEPGPVGALVDAWLAEMLVRPGRPPAPGTAESGHAPVTPRSRDPSDGLDQKAGGGIRRSPGSR